MLLGSFLNDSNVDGRSNMQTDAVFVQDAEDYPLCFVKMPFGNPGEESLKWSRFINGAVDNLSTIAHNALTATWRHPTARTGHSDVVFENRRFRRSSDAEAASINPRTPRDISLDCPTISRHDMEGNLVETPWIAEGLEEDVGDIPDILKSDSDFEIFATTSTAKVVDNAETEPKMDLSNVKESRPMESRMPKTRQQTRKKPRRTRKKQRGITMCLRRLLRQLLAGTGWIMDASIIRCKALRLAKTLVGPELENKIQIDVPDDSKAHLLPSWKQAHYDTVLSEIVTYSIGKRITTKELGSYVTLRRGPYRLSPLFVKMLAGRPWPPNLPNDGEMRALGCYHFGEKKRKSRLVRQSI